MSMNNTNPSTLFGGTWTQLENRFLLGAGSNYNVGTTGGEATHTLTINEMPSHAHSISQIYNHLSSATTTYHRSIYANQAQQAMGTDSTGGGQAHNNMPPYLVVYIWKRTA